jgi:hypothetical protein
MGKIMNKNIKKRGGKFSSSFQLIIYKGKRKGKVFRESMLVFCDNVIPTVF